MLQTWNKSIFAGVRAQLLNAAMSFLHRERKGEAFDSQLVIGVRQSFGKLIIMKGLKSLSLFLVNLCTDSNNKLQIYLEFFEKEYVDKTKEFYSSHSHQHLSENGVQNYMKYVSSVILTLFEYYIFNPLG